MRLQQTVREYPEHIVTYLFRYVNRLVQYLLKYSESFVSFHIWYRFNTISPSTLTVYYVYYVTCEIINFILISFQHLGINFMRWMFIMGFQFVLVE